MIRTVYETAYERETDIACRIVAERPVREMPMKDERRAEIARRSAKCRRSAMRLLDAICAVGATLTVLAAVNGDWQSAFAGASLVGFIALCARITK